MEQHTKNFDRGIEKMMNEHEVAPPFGMWNRISSELEAMPAAVAAAGPPVATSLIPKRAMVGIIAALLVIGAAVATDYMVSHNNKNGVNTAPVGTPIASAKKVTKTTTDQTIPVKQTIAANPAEIALKKVAVKHITATNPVQSTIQAAKQVQPAVNAPVATTTTPEGPVINNNAEVPTPVNAAAQTGTEETQSYYFPPIDGNSQARENNSLAAAKARINDMVPYNGDERPKLFGSRNKFHPKKRQKFQYGNIIR